MTRPASHLLRVSEVATLFHVNARTVTKWCQAGLLSAVRTLGAHRRISVESVRVALIAGGTSAAEADLRIAKALGRQAGSS